MKTGKKSKKHEKLSTKNRVIHGVIHKFWVFSSILNAYVWGAENKTFHGNKKAKL